MAKKRNRSGANSKSFSKPRRGLMGFNNFKERGEWVEVLFMAAALLHGFHVLKPWGESLAYDLVLELGGSFLRVQVKSTVFRNGAGYLCEFKHRHSGQQRRYTKTETDIFVAYVIPEQAWYIIPAHRIAGLEGQCTITIAQRPNCRNKPKYEHYRNAWHLLTKSRDQLLAL